jgi:general stress protein 26
MVNFLLDFTIHTYVIIRIVNKEIPMDQILQKKASSIISKSGNAFIGSIDSEGFPNIKAMLTPREIRGISEFYFSTNTSSMRVTQFRINPKSSLYFYIGTDFIGLMLTGTMEIMTDKDSKELIWREGDTIYYSKGVSDPDYCVLKFTAEKGRLYENFSSISFDID